MGPDLAGYTKPPCHHHGGVCCYMKPHVMNMLPPTPYVLWVHGRGLTSLVHNQCTEMLSNQATENPSCRTIFGRICKTTMPSLGWCILLGEEPHVMNVLPHIPQIYECMGKICQAWDIINTLCTYSSKPQNTQYAGPDLVETAKPPSHPQVGVYCYTKNNMPCMGCQAFHVPYGCMGKV